MCFRRSRVAANTTTIRGCVISQALPRTHLIAALCLRHRRYKAVPQYNAQQQAVGSINRAAVPRNETAAVLHARSSLQQRGDQVTKRANHLEQQRLLTSAQ